MARIAAGNIALGLTGIVEAGAEVPETYIDSRGDTQPVDFDRLERMDLLEPDGPPPTPPADLAPPPLAPSAAPDPPAASTAPPPAAAAALPAFDVDTDTIDRLLAYVGEDAARAAEVAAAEQARRGGARRTLLGALDRLSGPAAA